MTEGAAETIMNRTGVSAVEGKSPFELWFGKKPSNKHLKVIGTTCYAHIPEQKRKKLDKEALKCVLIGSTIHLKKAIRLLVKMK